MKTSRTFFVCLLLLCGSVTMAGELRSYEVDLNVAWEAAVKTVRDVSYVLVDSDREEGVFVMRNKSKLNHKKGYFMEVSLSRAGDTTTVQVVAADPTKAKRTAKHITRYMNALDERLE